MRYRTVAVFSEGVEYREFDNMESADAYNLAMMNIKGVRTLCDGDDGESLVVYYMPMRSDKKGAGMIDSRMTHLLRLLYNRGYAMFGEDEEIEKLLEELNEEEEG